MATPTPIFAYFGAATGTVGYNIAFAGPSTHSCLFPVERGGIVQFVNDSGIGPLALGYEALNNVLQPPYFVIPSGATLTLSADTFPILTEFNGIPIGQIYIGRANAGAAVPATVSATRPIKTPGP
jgi:hypothetical protein